MKKRSQAILSPEIEEIYSHRGETECARPLFLAPVPAGFPSPADDYQEGELDLNKHLIKHPSATFFVKVAGDSMLGAGIHPGDILIVDRSLEPADRKIVIAIINGELTVKRFRRVGKKLMLMPENDDYEPITVAEGMEFEVWGVVTTVVHPV